MTSVDQKNVFILSEEFELPQLRKKRRIWLYLPLNYEKSDQHYPVLYLQDGQNLFDKHYAAYDEWGIHKVLNTIELETNKGLIVVGIDNAGQDRIAEYSPYSNRQHGGGQGDLYTEFIVKTLKPYIDKHFRTLPQREHTGIGGSSMGGLISLYAGLKYPNIFEKWCIFSPSLWYSSEIFDFAYTSPRRFFSKIYLLAGTKESAFLIPQIRNLHRVLKNNGYSSEEIKLIIRNGGTHDEQFWGREFGDACRWLYAI